MSDKIYKAGQGLPPLRGRRYAPGTVIPNNLLPQNLATLIRLGQIVEALPESKPARHGVTHISRSAAVREAVENAKPTPAPAPDPQPEAEPDAPETDPQLLDLLDQSVQDLAEDLKEIEDPATIEALIAAEQSGKTRSSAIDVLTDRLAELGG